MLERLGPLDVAVLPGCAVPAAELPWMPELSPDTALDAQASPTAVATDGRALPMASLQWGEGGPQARAGLASEDPGQAASKE